MIKKRPTAFGLHPSIYHRSSLLRAYAVPETSSKSFLRSSSRLSDDSAFVGKDDVQDNITIDKSNHSPKNKTKNPQSVLTTPASSPVYCGRVKTTTLDQESWTLADLRFDGKHLMCLSPHRISVDSVVMQYPQPEYPVGGVSLEDVSNPLFSTPKNKISFYSGERCYARYTQTVIWHIHMDEISSIEISRTDLQPTHSDSHYNLISNTFHSRLTFIVLNLTHGSARVFMPPKKELNNWLFVLNNARRATNQTNSTFKAENDFLNMKPRVEKAVMNQDGGSGDLYECSIKHQHDLPPTREFKVDLTPSLASQKSQPCADTNPRHATLDLSSIRECRTSLSRLSKATEYSESLISEGNEH